MSELRILDADCHVSEPLGLWEKYLDPAFRERAPRLRWPPGPEPSWANIAELALHQLRGGLPTPVVDGEPIWDRVSDELQRRGQQHAALHHPRALSSGYDAG